MFAFELKATVSKQEMMQQYYKLNSFKLLDEEKTTTRILGRGCRRAEPLDLTENIYQDFVCCRFDDCLFG